MKRRLKKPYKYGLYVVAFVALFGLIYSIEKTLFPVTFKEEDDFDYVNKTIFEDVIPVVSEEDVIKRPYKDESIKILKGFYDYQDDSESQENSLIYSENTYIQNSGVSYGNNTNFDVLAILDGIVIDVREDSLLGKIIEVRHSNDVISIYQSLSEVNYKINDSVVQGDVLGKSGVSNISPELNSHLHFELIVSGTTVNPENYYEKSLSDLQK